MDLLLKDKTALVTGAGSQIGYGRAISLALAEEGCHVACADIDIEGAQKTAAQVKGKGVKSLPLRMDVTKRPEVESAVKTAVDTFGRIDILVNNAGASSRVRPFLEMTEEDWEYDISINLKGQMRVARVVVPYMIEQGYGRIINTSGGQGFPGISIYGAAKGGVVRFTEALAKEVAAKGVIVNAIAPGHGRTGLVYSEPEESLEADRRRSLLGRLCTPEDVAPAVVFLASDRCSYMVGQVLHLGA